MSLDVVNPLALWHLNEAIQAEREADTLDPPQQRARRLAAARWHRECAELALEGQS